MATKRTGPGARLMQRCGGLIRRLLASVRQAFLITGGWLLVFGALFFGAEAWFRYAHNPTPDLVRYWFYESINIERWDYLEDHRDQLLTDDRREEILPGREANEEYWEHPEEDRPAYDRVEKSYFVKTNSNAFRDYQWPKTPPSGKTRVLFIGDSVTFGRGIDAKDRYTDIMRKTAPRHLELLNAGDPGCSLRCEANTVDELLPLRPDLIVLQASPNDVDQSMWRLEASKIDPSSLLFRLRVFLAQSRAFLALAYWLERDEQVDAYQQALKAVGEYYKPQIDHIFGLARSRRIPIAILSIPASDGVTCHAHLADACDRYDDICLGTIEVDFRDKDRWLSRSDQLLFSREPGWITGTVEEIDMDLEMFGSMFPYRQFFVSQIHPNRLANQIAAGQIAEWLKVHWKGWSIPISRPTNI